jgi:hypothetical protein
MAEGNDYSAIGPLNAAAQKDAMALLQWIILDMIVTVVVLYIAGAIANIL